jgi:serine/threonine-protein kinase
MRLLADPSRGHRHVASSQRVCCRLAAGSDPQLTAATARLLRSRLQLPILIILSGFAVTLFRGLLHGPASPGHPLWLALNGCEVAVLAVAWALLWSPWPLSVKRLRLIELTAFGMIAAAFTWLQIDTYHRGALLRALVPGQEALVRRLVGVFAALPWFVLIVLYGTFIPTTWRRCAIVVGGIAALPMMLILAGSQLDADMGGYVLSALPITATLIGTAVAIAVLGSHKIHKLQEKAHEAERIGQYRLKEVLGGGGMGTVYLAEHVLLRRPCAIKVIRPEQAGDPGTLLRFEREVQATATLTHWNTIEVFDYGHTSDGTFYYVMEYLPGINLEDMVRQHGPLPPARAVHLLRQVCQALREAHGIGLIHRDVKPSNIIACERGGVYDVAKLLDFGVVKSLAMPSDSIKLTTDGALAGSPSYMSPEQARGRTHLDARSDIYSVGAVGHFLLTGKLVFERETAMETLQAHGYEPFMPGPEFRRHVPVRLQQIIRRCLMKDPALRFPDAATLDQALAACQGIGAWSTADAEAWWRELHFHRTGRD